VIRWFYAHVRVGIGDGATTTGETTSHSYADPGDYTVELTVTDEYGNTDTATSTITVTSRTPDASFTVDLSTGTADTSFSFDGSSSSDPDGSMLTYESGTLVMAQQPQARRRHTPTARRMCTRSR